MEAAAQETAEDGQEWSVFHPLGATRLKWCIIVFNTAAGYAIKLPEHIERNGKTKPHKHLRQFTASSSFVESTRFQLTH